jgi:cell wall assembly regulator SMI1
MGDVRERLRAALATIEGFADGRFELRLRPPATEQQLVAAETEFGMRLPEDLRELYLLHDGQNQLLSTADLFLGEPFATVERALAAWRDLAGFHNLKPGDPPLESGFGAAAPELRAVEHDIAWFPFGVRNDEVKEAYWVDMNPIEGRPVGQVRGAVATPDADQPAVLRLKTRMPAAQWHLLERFPKLTQLALDLDADSDPNDHDWRTVSELASLEIRGGSLRSLEFVAQLPQLNYLRLNEPARLSVAGLPRLSDFMLFVVAAPVPDDIELLARLELPTKLAGPIEWFRALEGRIAAGVWTGVYDGGDDSTWADLTRLNWAERRAIMTEMGLPGF